MPLHREFRLITHALSPEQAAQLARGVQHFHSAQNAFKLAPAGERALRVHAERVNFRDLLRAPPPESPEIVVTSVGLVDHWFTHVCIVALIPSDNARAIRERFNNVQVIAYERHEDLARILAVLAREAAPLASPHGH